MKPTLLRLLVLSFLSVSLLSNYSCKNSYDNGKDNNLITSHDYKDGEGKDTKLYRAMETEENAGRQNWQKPGEVLRSLGDLSDKVVADIGAGAGYFSFRMARLAKKVIATDIDQAALDAIDSIKNEYLSPEIQAKLETRLVKEDNPLLGDEEVDVVFIANTFAAYIEKPVEYLTMVLKGLKPGGIVCIIDFKMKRLPAVFPPVDYRLPLFEVENLLENSGFQLVAADDKTLDFQYIVIAGKPME